MKTIFVKKLTFLFLILTLFVSNSVFAQNKCVDLFQNKTDLSTANQIDSLSRSEVRRVGKEC